MSWLKRLFGGSSGPEAVADPIEYKGFRITPTPIGEGGQFRLSARIEAEIDGEVRVHELIRADVIRDADEAKDAAISKAKQMIDQMGHRLFNT